MRWLLISISGWLILSTTPALGAGDKSNNHQAQLIVERTLAAHGGIAAIEQAGGIQIILQGEFDLSARLQGRSPFRPERTPIYEHISIDTNKARLAYDLDWFNYHGSNQQLREIYDQKNRQLFIDRLNRNGGWLPFETVADPRQRLSRVLPQLLLADALQQHSTLHFFGNQTGAIHQVSYKTTAGDQIKLFIDQQSLLLQSASSIIDMPLLGNTEISWHWKTYSNTDGDQLFPSGFEVFLGGKLLKKSQMKVIPGINDQLFKAPDGISIPSPPEQLIPATDFVPYGQREPEVELLAPQVYMVVNLRPGFRLLFVEFQEFVVAVDAPTGWYEMQQIPPMNWSRGDDLSALGEKYLRAIRQTIPDKPVRYLVLTHHHSDHIGGLLPFVNTGATVIAGKAAIHMAQLAVMSQRGTPDVMQTNLSRSMSSETVTGLHTIEDQSMQLQLLELPNGNPKADNYLMVYLPRQKILYTTGFIYPLPESVFPPKESIPLSSYFVNWLDNSGLQIDAIYNVHGQGLVTDWQLDKIRQLTPASQ